MRGHLLPDKYFNQTQLAKGTKVEFEHTDSKHRAKQIAKDHLYEFPRYYVFLEQMEKKLKATGPYTMPKKKGRKKKKK